MVMFVFYIFSPLVPPIEGTSHGRCRTRERKIEAGCWHEWTYVDWVLNKYN